MHVYKGMQAQIVFRQYNNQNFPFSLRLLEVNLPVHIVFFFIEIACFDFNDVNVCMYEYACVCACVRVCVCAYVCEHLATFTCVHTCVYVCMHVCMYILQIPPPPLVKLATVVLPPPHPPY